MSIPVYCSFSFASAVCPHLVYSRSIHQTINPLSANLVSNISLFSNRFLIGNDFSNLHNTCTARHTHLYQQQLYANYKLTRDNLCPVLCFAFDMSDMFVDIVVNLIPRVYPAFQHQQFITTNI